MTDIKKTQDIKEMETIDNMMNFLKTDITLVNFVKDFNDMNGFLWCDDKRMNQIYDGMNIDEFSSPAAFALYLRKCQALLQKESL